MTPTLKGKRNPPQDDLGEAIESQDGTVRSYSSYLTKLGAVGFVLGGVGWIAVYLISLKFASAPPISLLPLELSLLLYMGTIAISVFGLVGLHILQRESYGGVGRAGFYTILASSLAIMAGGVGHLLGSMALEWLAYPVGMLGVIVGFSLYGAATVQAKIMPCWYGVMLIAFLPISVLFGAYDNLWVGVVQIVLGSVLWTRRPYRHSYTSHEHELIATANTHSTRSGI